MLAQLVQYHAGAGLFDAGHLRRTRHALGFVDFNKNIEPVQVKLCHAASGTSYEKLQMPHLFVALTK